jgi:hypothetical protein
MSRPRVPDAVRPCCAFPLPLWGREQNGALFTSPLEGEVDAAQQRREGGKPQMPALAATPLPDPPPQGGREQKSAALGSGTQ